MERGEVGEEFGAEEERRTTTATVWRRRPELQARRKEASEA